MKKDWIEDCEKMRRAIPWRNYSMNSDVSSSSEEGEEEEEEEEEKDVSMLYNSNESSSQVCT